MSSKTKPKRMKRYNPFRRSKVCKMCQSTNIRHTNYPDAVLFICNDCSFPWRVKR